MLVLLLCSSHEFHFVLEACRSFGPCSLYTSAVLPMGVRATFHTTDTHCELAHVRYTNSGPIKSMWSTEQLGEFARRRLNKLAASGVHSITFISIFSPFGSIDPVLFTWNRCSDPTVKYMPQSMGPVHRPNYTYSYNSHAVRYDGNQSRPPPSTRARPSYYAIVSLSWSKYTSTMASLHASVPGPRASHTYIV